MDHLVFYNGKVVSMSYVKDAKKQFNLACMRVHDNNARFGYVLTPKGDVFHVIQGKRTAYLLKGEAKQDALKNF
jgi:hypothetical protein